MTTVFLFVLSLVALVYSIALAWGSKLEKSVVYRDWWIKAVGAVILAICAAALAIAAVAAWRM